VRGALGEWKDPFTKMNGVSRSSATRAFALLSSNERDDSAIIAAAYLPTNPTIKARIERKH